MFSTQLFFISFYLITSHLHLCLRVCNNFIQMKSFSLLFLFIFLLFKSYTFVLCIKLRSPSDSHVHVYASVYTPLRVCVFSWHCHFISKTLLQKVSKRPCSMFVERNVFDFLYFSVFSRTLSQKPLIRAAKVSGTLQKLLLFLVY